MEREAVKNKQSQGREEGEAALHKNASFSFLLMMAMLLRFSGFETV